jgi:predicted CoA-substrate-specific enzyme activase
MKRILYGGLDCGSTTIKLCVLDGNGRLLYTKYERHFSEVKNSLYQVLEEAHAHFGEEEIKLTVSGSAGISMAQILGLNFVQEVIACKKAVERYVPGSEVSIELGGEDAKVTFLSGALEQRMNGTCAGGTGAFIDQMASLLQVDALELNELAKEHTNIYPIASRCGVFAKTDIQPLLNEGAQKSNIAASIFQAVVNQTLGGLCCGRPIEGKVVFLGGPLYYLSELRKRFITTLHLKEEHAICPKNAHLFVAMGSALSAVHSPRTHFKTLLKAMKEGASQDSSCLGRLEPLFASSSDLEAFRQRHAQNQVPKASLKEHKGNAFLGIDAGSTTTKAVLIDEDQRVLYTYYGSNQGTPLNCAVHILKDLYQKLPKDARIAYSTVTGYGEALILNGLRVDVGEIETIAHYKAAKALLPEVDFVLDIGGQDMKCLQIKNGNIQSLMLNEACSSGCGSFIQTFAQSLNMETEPFAQAGMKSKNPVDLGTRCTVFMNSRVKQAQKEGAKVEDISAGLAYSVIKNALYKVMKIKDPDALGQNIVVQGGTFYNEAILRAFECITGKQPVRPDMAGLMGAYGAAIVALEKFDESKTTSLLKENALKEFAYAHRIERCHRCGNRCTLTHTDFSDGKGFVSGNRCERGAYEPKEAAGISIPNLYDYKYERLFRYQPKEISKAIRGSIGIPRVLNMYENYPLWFTFLDALGFRVVLSARSSKDIYLKGIKTIVSDTVCYPAKIAHGHMMDLVEKGVGIIFYPCVQKEKKEWKSVDNHYNCPVVTSYPELIRNNLDVLQDKKIKFMHPFLPLHDKKALRKRLFIEFSYFGISQEELDLALDKGWEEYERYKSDVRKKGEEALETIRAQNIPGVVLAGRPYHLDPEIHHGIPKMISELQMAVLSEDSVCHLGDIEKPMRIHDQWTYHSRVLRAAKVVF